LLKNLVNSSRNIVLDLRWFVGVLVTVYVDVDMISKKRVKSRVGTARRHVHVDN